MRPSVPQRVLALPMIGLGGLALAHILATASVFLFLYGPSTGLGKGVTTTLLLLPTMALLALGLSTFTGKLPLARTGGGKGLCPGLLGAATTGLLFLQLCFYAIAFPPLACGCSDRTKAYFAAMKSDLKNLASQQEIYFEDHGVYTTDPQAMSFTSSDGVAVTIAIGERSWSARAAHRELESSCVLWGGDEPPTMQVHAGRTVYRGKLVCDDDDSRAQAAIEGLWLPRVAEEYLLFTYHSAS